MTMNQRNRRSRHSPIGQVEALEERTLLSTAASNADVYYSYETLLDRTPTTSELSYYASQLDSGANPVVVYSAVLNSPEHAKLVSNGTYTGTPLSYTSISTFDTTFAADVAAVNTIPVVTSSSLGTTANITTYVDSLYTTLLKRSPTTAEATYYVDRIAAGASLNSVVASFLGSPEYLALVAAGTASYSLGTGTNGDTSEATAFISSLYTGLLGHAATTGGAAFWLSAIDSGTSPATVITAFLTSSEYITDTVGVVATALSDNISATSGGTETATGTDELATSFTTGSTAETLTEVNLLLDETATGTAKVEIYSDGGLEPGTLVGTLTSPSSYSSTLASTAFTSTGIALSANTTYWVVLVASSGSFGWSWTSTETGSGTGFTDSWASSTDSGSSWFTFDSSPLQMTVYATAS